METRERRTPGGDRRAESRQSAVSGRTCVCKKGTEPVSYTHLDVYKRQDILEPVLRDAGQEMWQALDRIISAKNAMEGIVAKEMYIRGFLDYERLVCEKDSKI